MALKMTPQGMMIYLTMAIYAVALILTLFKRKKAGLNVFALGFVVALVSFGYRWQHVSHWPMQNLFEVFLTLGMLCYPMSVLCKRYLSIASIGWDMLVGIILLIPAGFVFHAEPQHLPPALQSPLFAPHVAVYMISYVLMFKAYFLSVMQLTEKTNRPVRVLTIVFAILSLGFYLVIQKSITMPLYTSLLFVLGGAIKGFLLGCLILISREEKQLAPEKATYVMTCLGFPFLTLGLILGSVWGKLAWGDYWGWDPKELWSLASWLVYVGYFHVRYMFGQKHARLNSSLAILGMVFIVITLLWVNLSRLFPGLHSYAS
jgi:cytochrome c-type biogenesis protein CcsB